MYKRSNTSFFLSNAYILLGEIMDLLFSMAEEEMMSLHHPYVGTEHLMLAYLKKYQNRHITYEKFREYVLKIIGCSYKKSDFLLYTPILRKIKKECTNEYDAMIRILTDDNSIAYNLLLSQGENIEAIYLDILYRENEED